jgi:broad specificity phosphatase PhoE
MSIKPNRLLLVVGLAVLLTPLSALTQVTVIFTRHAEKAATPATDPPLTAAGEQRAKVLASMLGDSRVDAIYVSEFKRTQQTAAPLAARLHIKPQIILANDVQGLLKSIRARQSGAVLVVGHSNKLPEIIAALGGPTVAIPDSDYDNLFIMTVGPVHSTLLRLRYGSSAPVNVPAGSMKDTMTPPTKK